MLFSVEREREREVRGLQFFQAQDIDKYNNKPKWSRRQNTQEIPQTVTWQKS